MPRSPAPLVLACGLLGASSVAGLRVNKEEGASFAMEEVLGRLALEGLPQELNASRLRILADVQSGRPGGPEEESGYDCEALPHMCQAPFHCDQWT
eukprot:CAMPEP_0175431978 /NCGR_PEP_ID=MMETSP0095-20121207/52648_1 /TAXON_ID=311494 /ORGANISM="Alexandrium monilatum, Strain CCMP3105" /LENGTH=95 /DNA_ID=CAMNT_0016731467 /DNA_START=1 /DNA_END=284 /DNA_ORIENTATION=+